MDVRRIKEEVDPDFFSDAHSRTGPAKLGDSCESKVLEVVRESNTNMNGDVSLGTKVDESNSDDILLYFTAMPFWVDQCTSEFHDSNERESASSYLCKLSSCVLRTGHLGTIWVNEPILDFGRKDKFVVTAWSRDRNAGLVEREGDLLIQRAREIHMKTIRIIKVSNTFSIRRIETEAEMIDVVILGLILGDQVPFGNDEAVARHRVHVSSIPDKDEMYTKALERDVEVCLFENLVVIGILTFREAEIGEGKMFGLELELETTKVVVIMERLEEAEDRQKSYANNSRKPLEFEVENRELLKVTPWKDVVHFGKKGKDIKVKKSKNDPKPTRNEETSTRERFEANLKSRIKIVVEKSQEHKRKGQKIEGERPFPVLKSTRARSVKFQSYSILHFGRKKQRG
ncbi:hypothetical protein Tco_0990864 [Tanacetum coccineum]|uniref:Uncharacterized protein n=1 Tax=Tanacetum coccineum TaxID=301880 RepID=A0ABQ5EXX0_9ASTR